jgi:hypothetical protein
VSRSLAMTSSTDGRSTLTDARTYPAPLFFYSFLPMHSVQELTCSSFPLSIPSSEMLFHPFVSWPRHGPVTKLFSTFVWSKIPVHSKISVLAYISSYYAIAIAAFMSTANWIIIGIWSASLDDFYLESWQVFLTCVIIFCFVSNICSAVRRSFLSPLQSRCESPVGCLYDRS